MPKSNVAVVTGAGSGIGRQTAVRLNNAGWNVVLTSRTRSALVSTVKLAEPPQGGAARTLVIPADISKPQGVRQVIDQTVSTFGRIDALANVAGQAPMLPIEKTTPDIAQSCIDTNLTSIINLTAAAWPTMAKQRSGVVVNVSSMAAFDPFPELSAYAAAKAGVNMFTQCTADEGAPHNIRSVAIAPGAVDTPMLRSLFDETAIPPEKTIDPDRVAKLIVDCITGHHRFTPGETIQLPSP